MGTVIEIREVTIKVDAVTVGTSCTIYRIVASVIGTIRVGAREDEEVHIVQNVKDTRVAAGAELIDETKHEDHTCHLVTMHRRAVEELRFAIGLAIVEAHT